MLLAAVLLGPQPTLGEGALVARHPVYGGVETTFGTCPDTVEAPPPGTTCVETYIILWRGYWLFGGGSAAPVEAPWNYYAETVHLDFTGEPEPIITVLRDGYGEVDGTVIVDTVHLGSAEADVRLPMGDGTSLEFVGSWVATSDPFVFGNDGPAIGGRQHFVGDCATFVALGHQKGREAAMTGTLNGQAVHGYSAWPDYIFNNNFRFIEVLHGRTCN